VLTLLNVVLTKNTATGSGGGIYVSGGALNATNVTFSHNVAALNSSLTGNGGGVCAQLTELILSEVTISDNIAGHGGGLWASRGMLNLSDALISDNVAGKPENGSGGGISTYITDLVFSDVFIKHNSAIGTGGGIQASGGSANLSKVTVMDNVAGPSDFSAGGGILMGSDIGLLSECIITGNVVEDGAGGGMWIASDSLHIINSVISNNTASGTASFIRGSGGGIASRGNFVIENSTIADNLAGSGGGGIFNDDQARIIGCTISGNEAVATGGGVLTRGPSRFTVLVNSTIFGNSADSGGGIYNFHSVVTLIFATISGNSANVGGGIIFINRTFAEMSAHSSIIAGNLGSNLEGTLTSGDFNIIDMDPKLGMLQDNGGPTFTMALLAGSPAIDAGDSTATDTIDQRGYARSVDGGSGTSRADAGAFEYGSGPD